MNRRAHPILLTRPQPQLERSAHYLEAAGYRVLRMPLMQIVPPTHTPTSADVRWAESAQWLIFTSQHAVNGARRLWPQPPTLPRVAAVGQATASSLAQGGWPVHWQAPGGSSESLISDRQAPHWQGKIAILAGRGGRRSIKQQLTARGCEVRKILLYQRQALDYSKRELAERILAQPIGIFSSGFGLRRWRDLLQQHALPAGLTLDMLVASRRLCKLANQLGFAGRIQALQTISDEAILTALNEWNHD